MMVLTFPETVIVNCHKFEELCQKQNFALTNCAPQNADFKTHNNLTQKTNF